MRTILQRVLQAKLVIDNTVQVTIARGLLVYVCVAQQDSAKECEWMIRKIINLRIFDDKEGNFNLSLKDIEGAILLIPNFTLLANVKKGNRPNFFMGISPTDAKEKYEYFVMYAKKQTIAHSGIFGSKMLVESQADGPCNIIIDTPQQ